MSDTAANAVFPTSTAPEAPTNGGIFGRSAASQPVEQQPAQDFWSRAGNGLFDKSSAATPQPQALQPTAQPAQQPVQRGDLSKVFPNSTVASQPAQQPSQGQPPAAQDGKPAEGTQPRQEAATEAASATPDIPEWLDASDPRTADVAPVVKELGLDRPAVERLQALNVQLQDKQVAAWEAEAMSQFTEADISEARSAVKVFGDAALAKALTESGLGSHPAVIRAFRMAWRARSVHITSR